MHLPGVVAAFARARAVHSNATPVKVPAFRQEAGRICMGEGRDQHLGNIGKRAGEGVTPMQKF